jgi:hypothetical protein
MDSIIKNSLQRGISYKAYRDLVKSLVEKKSTTGLDKSDDLMNYTKLNDRRMNRWDKTLKISLATENKIKAYQNDITWLVITESWCGDAAHVLPVLSQLSDLNDHIDFKVVLRDENQALMDAFLTNGNKAIPKLIMIDNKTLEVLYTYGPRPSEATYLVKRFKAKYGTLTADFKQDLQYWYNDNKGQNIINDITEILCQLESSVCL